MAALLMGVAGAAAGSALASNFMLPLWLANNAASIGYVSFSFAGSQLFSQSTDLPPAFGPRLGDLKIQTSTYGSAIPRAYGTVRLAGNVIWGPPIVETATTTSTTSGGKGGGGGATQTQTTYSYSADFAVAICEGPIIGISRIWANGKLIHNLSATASIGSVLASDRDFTVYTGSETQTADPTMEAAEGAGNVPGYRGTAYVVFNDMPLGEFGNRIPNVEFEVVVGGSSAQTISLSVAGTGADDIYTPSAGEAWYATAALTGKVWITTHIGGAYNLSLIDIATGETEFTVLNTSVGTNYATMGIDENGYAFVQGVTPTRVYRVNLFGEVKNFTVGSYFVYGAIGESGNVWINYGFGTVRKYSGIDWAAHTSTYSDTTGGGGFNRFLRNAAGISGRVYGVCLTGGTIGWADTTTMAITTLPTVAPNPLTGALIGGDGNIYAFSDGGHVLYKYDQDGALLGSLTLATTLGYSYHVGIYDQNGFVWVIEHSPFDQPWTKINALTMEIEATVANGYPPASARWSHMIGEAYEGVPVVWGSGANSYGKLGIIPALNNLTPGTADLADIVSDLCLQSDLVAGDIDVTDLSGNAVDGYVIANRGPIRGMIEPLMAAFFFDATESDNKIKFVQRGGASAVTIPLADLSAQEGNLGNTADPFDLTRQQEMELPLELNVVYLNSANNYQPSQQPSRRTTRNSQLKVTIQLPIVMSDNKAKQIADAMMYSAWQERMAGSFATSRKYSVYEPTDVVTVISGDQSQVVRLLQKDEGANGIVRWKGVIEDSTVYTQTSTGAAMTTPDNVVPLIGPTLFVPLDIALLREVDDDFGFYYGLSGAADGWIGAQLYQSTDGGTDYNAVTNGLVLTGPTMGTAAAALGTTGITASTNEKVDEINTVSVVLTAGTLSTITRNAMLAGGNVFLIGDEIVQAMVCTLTATLTYTLSRLLRGRLGTEWAMGTHLAGDRFIVLDDNIRTLPQTPNDWNQEYHYKPVSIGKTLGGTNALTFTDTAIRKKPLAPWHLSGGRSTALDLIIEWVRRTRDPAITWNTPTDPPLFETAERYAVDILNGAGLVVRTIEVTEQTATYTVAQQTTDFGSAQASIPVTVCPISPEFGRGYTIAGTL